MPIFYNIVQLILVWDLKILQGHLTSQDKNVYIKSALEVVVESWPSVMMIL